MQKKKNKKSYARLREIMGVLKRRDIVHGVSPVKLRNILEDLGPTYVKLGQIMSMRSDILPQNYCDELTKLRMEVRPMPFSVVLKTLEEEYGQPPDKIFKFIDENSLGSASIAQVHRAVLAEDEREVVIKIQRPHIREIMAEDIKLMKRAAGLLRVIGDTGNVIDFEAVIDELWMVSQQEMDFLLEADNCEHFYHLNEDILYISSPLVDRRHTTAKVLVMDYIHGKRIDEMKLLRELGYDMREICEKLCENYIKQILEDGFFHADPHPGNIWISGGKIVWLDLGMMGRLSPDDKKVIKNAVKAVVQGDIYEVKNAVLTLGRAKGKINHSLLYTDIDDMLAKYISMGMGAINMGDVVFELLEIAKRHNISMPSNITMLARGLITFEGVISRCCPELSMMEVLSEHVFSDYMKGFNIKHEAKSAGRDIYNSARKSLEIPSLVADMLKAGVKGQSKVNLELLGADEPLEKLNHMVHELIVGIIIAAALIGSSFICTTKMQPIVFGIPLLGFLGYFGAFLLGVVLIFQFYKKKKK